jgi:endonuclease/exonuclease/phosphatase family metal-dependent hydrolase
MGTNPTLRIASFNTWSGCRPAEAGKVDHVVDFIVGLAFEYDYLALQEVHVSHDSLGQRFVAPRTPGHRPGPLDIKLGNRIIERVKKTHRYAFAPHFAKPALHDYEMTELPVMYGNLELIRRDTVTVARSEVGMIYGTGEINTEVVHPESNCVTGRPASRKANITTLVTRNGPLTIAAVHGVHSRLGKTDIPARSHQTVQIAHAVNSQRKRLKLLAQPPRVLVIGDLNLTSQNETFIELLHHPRVFGDTPGINLNQEFGISDTRTKWYPKSKTVREADFALVAAAVRPEIGYYGVNQSVPSDHALLELTLTTMPGT